MINLSLPPFSQELQQKISHLLPRKKTTHLGKISFTSPLILAPMSGQTDTPFRLLMQDLGSGGSITELISSHGLHHQSEKTLQMMRPHPLEKNVGIQFFGEDPVMMAQAAHKAQEEGAMFVDINLGCPVRKVVCKGAGSALLKDLDYLYTYLSTIKAAIQIPLTIKIRTGWNQSSRNANEVLLMAKELGIEFVTLHGRTRDQQYSGKADWDYIEQLASQKILPLVGNGDLNSPDIVRERLKVTSCQALMLGRGPLHNPFLFLESLDEASGEERVVFTPQDLFEVILRYHAYLSLLNDGKENLHYVEVQLKKMIVSCISGFKNASAFRGQIFSIKAVEELLENTHHFIKGL